MVRTLALAFATALGSLPRPFDARPPPPCRPARGRLAAAATSVDVGGVSCVETTVVVTPSLDIRILEADADAQEDLVNLALEAEDATEAGNVGDPYGAVLWPAALAVARHLLATTPGLAAGLTVLELGAGTGLVSIVAADAGAAVTATDYNSIPLLLLGASAALQELTVATALFDMAGSDPLPPADVVVAADVMYETDTGAAAARRVVEAYRRGSRVIVGDSPGRAGRPAFLATLAEALPDVGGVEFFQVGGQTVTGDRHDLICGAGSVSVSKEPEVLSIALMDTERWGVRV